MRVLRCFGVSFKGVEIHSEHELCNGNSESIFVPVVYLTLSLSLMMKVMDGIS